MATLSPSALVASAKCFCAYNKKQHLAAQAYAMAVKAGISTDPVTLARLSRCTACIPEGEQDAVLAYLLSTVYGGSTSPSAIAVTGKCLPCIPPGYVEDVRTWLTAFVAGVSLNPTTLAYLSRGFMGMSKKQLKAIQIYSAQNIGGVTPTPPVPPFDGALCAATLTGGGGDKFDCYVVGGPYATLPTAGTAFTGDWVLGNSAFYVYFDTFNTYTVGAAGTLSGGVGFTGDWIYA
jgi:hypothetical protein